jgi:hypothetical protein
MEPKPQKLFCGVFFTALSLIGSGQLAFAQSTNENQPTQAAGNRIQKVFDTEQGSVTDHYLTQLSAGRNNAVKTCTYSGNFSVSDAKPKFEKLYRGLVFRKGSAQMFITAINNEGTNVSGSAYVEQTDAGRFNRNLVLPTNGFGGSIVTPLEKKPIRGAQYISGIAVLSRIRRINQIY